MPLPWSRNDINVMNDTNRVKTNDPDEQEEQILYQFGPMGVGITSARPALFTMTQQNCTKIFVTNRRLYGVRKMPKFAFSRHGQESGQIIFQFSYDKIISIQRVDYLLNKALWISYREGEKTKGIGIEAGFFWKDFVIRLEELLWGMI